MRDDAPDACTGYELTGDLDFDTDGDDDVDADDPNSYPNWMPIGAAGAAGAFTATFNGNHHRIDNLTIDRADSAALFSTISGQVRKAGAAERQCPRHRRDEQGRPRWPTS